MEPRRVKRLRPAIAPLTPELPAPKPITTKLAILHRTLEVERRRHAKEVNALVRYNELLEHQIAAQREAFQLLGQPLLPRERK
jgi:hypothetical protein